MNQDQFTDSWKNKSVFNKQLALNLEQLKANPYPEHWQAFLKAVSLIKDPKVLVDVGCGCGAFSELLKDNYPDISYIGYDYSSEAVELARSTWKQGLFEVKNYLDLTPDDFKNGEILHACGLHNILFDGDGCMDVFLSLKAKYLILGKISLTSEPSYFRTYSAYDEITTYQFYHNRGSLIEKINKNDYEFIEINPGRDITNLFLKKRHI